MSLTPRQFDSLPKPHGRNLERERVLVTSLQTVRANFSMCRPKEPLTADDLLGRAKPERSDSDLAE
jgi:hypothetical protein